MNTPPSILLACHSWTDFQRLVAPLPPKAKGDCFELLAREYLMLDARYDFENVWSTHGDVPKTVLMKLNLFDRDATGIDLVAATRDGKFWAVQCKYHQDEQRSLTREEATGLIAGRNRAHGEFELGLVATTANGRSANLAGEPGVEYLMGDVWRGLDVEFFARLHAHLRGATTPPPSLKRPRPYQQEALDSIVRFFANQTRGKVVMPCATGKSLVGFWSAEKLRARKVLVAVPNLSLVRQLLRDWTEQSLAKGRRPRWVVVCSDDSVADTVTARDLGVKVDTDPKEVAGWFRSNSRADVSVAFTTYQSGRVVAEAANEAHATFDLGIFDEAHRTAGREGAPFAYLVSGDNISIHKRVFMTATPRIFKGKNREDIISMDDPTLYGGEAFKMTFLAAMDRGIIPNLTIVATTISEKEVERLLRDKLFVRLQAEREDEVIRAEDLVSALALRKAMKKYGVRRTLGFYSSRKRCRLAGEIQRLIAKLYPAYGALEIFHVDGSMTAAERDSELRAFEQSESAFITNVRVLVEGVDCPSMDAVIFADPRQSVIDIVQGVGRALRPFPGKEAGYAIVPTTIQDDGTPSDEAYDQIVRVACALGSESEVILEYFASIAQGKPWTGRRVFEVLGDVELGVKVDLEKVNQAIAVRTYERTVEWKSFKDTRQFARSLHLRSKKEWYKVIRPEDVPSGPDRIYAKSGWKGWGDFLGTGNPRIRGRSGKRPTFRSFEAARAFARSLQLPSKEAWQRIVRPGDVPSAPNVVYAQSGWNGWRDFLGGKVRPRRNFKSFEAGREFARTLGLRTRDEWRAYVRSGRRPRDIPANPAVFYGHQWTSMGDWLGTGTVRNDKIAFFSFTEARAFARKLGLRDRSEWRAFVKSGRKPREISAKNRSQNLTTGGRDDLRLAWKPSFETSPMSSGSK